MSKKSNKNYGEVLRIRNTQKKCRFEADNYLTCYIKCEDGTESGLMMTEREFKAVVNRFWKNREDHPEVKSSKTSFWSKLFNF